MEKLLSRLHKKIQATLDDLLDSVIRYGQYLRRLNKVSRRLQGTTLLLSDSDNQEWRRYCSENIDKLQATYIQTHPSAYPCVAIALRELGALGVRSAPVFVYIPIKDLLPPPPSDT